MSKPNREWKVLPHGPLVELDSGLFSVVGEIAMPLMNIPRRMTVVRLRDGRLVIWSAISLDELNMAALERHGSPAFLVVPSNHHRMDAAAWKARYPAIEVVTPEGARQKTAEVVPVDTTSPDFGDPDVEFHAVAGTQGEEAALVVHRPEGTTLVLNDIIGNIRHPSGFGGWVLRLMGLAGDHAQVPKAVAMLIVKSKEQLGDQLMQWAAIADLRRIVVSHGEIIDREPRQVLRELASALK